MEIPTFVGIIAPLFFHRPPTQVPCLQVQIADEPWTTELRRHGSCDVGLLWASRVINAASEAASGMDIQRLSFKFGMLNLSRGGKIKMAI